MFRKTAIFVLFSAIALSVAPIRAQDDWGISMLLLDDGELQLTDLTGSVQSFELSRSAIGLRWERGILGGFFTPSSGDYYLTCRPGDTSGYLNLMRMVEIETQTILWEREIVNDFAGIPGCANAVFLPDDDSLIAVAINSNPESASGVVNPGQPVWRVQILDASSGELAHEIHADSPLVQALNLPADAVIASAVQHFTREAVIVRLAPLLDYCLHCTYIWHYTEESLTQVDYWGEVNDVLGDERIWIEYDPTLPTAQAIPPGAEMTPGQPWFLHNGSRYELYNVLKIVDSSGEARTIFYSPDRLLHDAIFVNDGRQIAFRSFPPIDFNQEDSPRFQAWDDKWYLLDRTGEWRIIVSADENRRLFQPAVIPAPEGYIVLWHQSLGDNPGRYFLEYHHGSETRAIWSAPAFHATAGIFAYTPPHRADNLLPFVDAVP